MIKIDFNMMTKQELRGYVIAHPDDRNASRIFVDRFTAEASSTTFAMPHSINDIKEFDLLIKQVVKQKVALSTMLNDSNS